MQLFTTKQYNGCPDGGSNFFFFWDSRSAHAADVAVQTILLDKVSHTTTSVTDLPSKVDAARQL